MGSAPWWPLFGNHNLGLRLGDSARTRQVRIFQEALLILYHGLWADTFGYQVLSDSFEDT